MVTDRGTAVGLYAGTIAISAAGAAAHRRLEGRFPRAVRAIVPGGAALGWAALNVLERRRPFDDAWKPGAAEVRTDAGFLIAGALPVAVGGAVGAALARRVKVRLGLGRIPAVIGVPAALATYDLFHYGWHRLSHQWGPAWRLHSVHHSPERLYWLNATRFHVAESLLEGTVEATLGHLFGLRPHQETAYRLFRSIYGQVQHANVAVDSGPLDRVFSTPDLHRWHHSELYEEGDTNYGAMTSIWDQLFGSYYRPDRPFTSKLGVGRMPEFPSRFIGLQRVPFDWEQIKAANASTWYDPPVRA